MEQVQLIVLFLLQRKSQSSKKLSVTFSFDSYQTSNDEVKKRDVKGLYKNDAENMNKSLNMFIFK